MCRDEHTLSYAQAKSEFLKVCANRKGIPGFKTKHFNYQRKDIKAHSADIVEQKNCFIRYKSTSNFMDRQFVIENEMKSLKTEQKKITPASVSV